MKATLEFNLPEEQGEWSIHKQADNVYMALVEIEQYLREVDRYQEEKDDIGKIRERYYTIINGYNISLDI